MFEHESIASNDEHLGVELSEPSVELGDLQSDTFESDSVIARELSLLDSKRETFDSSCVNFFHCCTSCFTNFGCCCQTYLGNWCLVRYFRGIA